MSEYWFFKCITCEQWSQDINRGDSTLKDLFNAIPKFIQAMALDTTGYFEISIVGHGSGLYNFLTEHIEHDVIVESEYNRYWKFEDNKWKYYPNENG